jgi:hypothetical protein
MTLVALPGRVTRRSILASEQQCRPDLDKHRFDASLVCLETIEEEMAMSLQWLSKVAPGPGLA